MLGWISRINQHLLLHSHRSLLLRGKMWTIQVMMIHVVICLWMTRICQHLLASNQSRILTLIQLSCTNGGDPPSQPPGGGAQVPVLVAINHQEAVHRDRGLAMVRHRTSRPCLWSITMSHLLLELLVRFLSLLIRIKCLVHRCRGRHLLHRLFLFLFHRARIFRFHSLRPPSPRNLGLRCCLVSRLERRILLSR